MYYGEDYEKTEEKTESFEDQTSTSTTSTTSYYDKTDVSKKLFSQY